MSEPQQHRRPRVHDRAGRPREPEPPGPPPQSAWAPVPVLLVALMAIGSVLMWGVSPLFWLWFASRVAYWTTGSPDPSLLMYFLVLAGIVTTAIVVGLLLGKVNRLHMRLTGLDGGHRHRAGWNRSMRDSRGPGGHGRLEQVMLISVGIVGTLTAIWFFFFARIGGPN